MRCVKVSVFAVFVACSSNHDSPSEIAGPVATPSPIPTSVVIRRGGPAELVVGDQSGATVRITWSGGAKVRYPNVMWTSSDPRVIELTVCQGCFGSATLDAKVAGTATITATVEGATASVVVSVAPLGSPQAVVWSGDALIDVTPPPGTKASWATAINDSSQVVGYASATGTDTNAHAFIWDVRRGAVDIGVLPGDVSSRATAINIRGEAVGWSRSMDGRRHAMKWSSSLGLRALPVPPGTIASEAKGINASGDIVGVIQTSAESFPYLWRIDGTAARLTNPSTIEVGDVVGVSDDGTIAGWLLKAGDRDTHATLWSTDATWTNRYIDPGPCDSYVYAEPCVFMAAAISRRGTVAINGDFGATFVWGSSRGFTIVPPGEYAEYGFALSGVNDAGIVSGNSRLTTLQYRAFVWETGFLASLLPLPSGRHISFAAGVNNSGQVAGYVQ